jgi:hypothetical protein
VMHAAQTFSMTLRAFQIHAPHGHRHVKGQRPDPFMPVSLWEKAGKSARRPRQCGASR